MARDESPDGSEVPGPDLDHYLAAARGHAETADTKQWASDLEDMLRAAWSLLTPAQKSEFREHPEVLAVMEMAGDAG